MMTISHYIRKVAFRQYSLLLAILITAFSLRSYYSYHVEKNGIAGRALSNFPTRFEEWTCLEDSLLDPVVTDTLKVDEYLNRKYTDGNHSVYLYVGYYHSHKKFVEIHTPENCQLNSGWELVTKKEKSLKHDAVGNGNIRIMEEIYKKNGKKYLLSYFYKLLDETTTGFFTYKYLVIRNSILRNRSDAAFVRVMLPVDERGVEHTEKISDEFIRDMGRVLFRTLP